MPIYEYRCRDCAKRNALLVLNVHNPPPLACRHCGSVKLDRLFSRFASPKSEEARMEALADPSRLGGLDENDPKSMAQFMKQMGQEMGEDLGDDFEDALSEAGEEGGESTTTDMD